MRNFIRAFESLPRPLQLILVASFTVAFALLIDGFRDFDVTRRLLFPEDATIAKVRLWSALIYATVFILGLPVAFLLWHWRDKNVRDQLENSRKDINLKEFQEVQLRAASAFNKDLDSQAREQLQIAALQQLRGFIRGDYGESFRRPAFELLLSGHATAMQRLGTKEISKWVRAEGRFSNKVRREIEKAVSALRENLDPVSKERIWIIRDDWDILVSTGFPLHHRNFDLLDLQGKSFRGLIIYHSSFIGSWLGQANFRETKIWSSDLIGANMIGCDFTASQMSSCHCEGADFSLSKFGNAGAQATSFRAAIFRGCDMKETQIENADFDLADLHGLILHDNDRQYVNPEFLKSLFAESLIRN